MNEIDIGLTLINAALVGWNVFAALPRKKAAQAEFEGDQLPMLEIDGVVVPHPTLVARQNRRLNQQF